MKPRFLTPSRVLLVCFALLAAVPLLAQDQFGRSVAISGGDVLVLKPGAGRGPATVYLFGMSADGRWVVSERLRPIGGTQSGEAFSPSVAAAGGIVLVASGDADGDWGAHVFSRRVGQAWEGTAKLPLTADAGDAAGPPSTVDLASVMRILSPPQRVVALSATGSIVAVSDGASRPTVRVLERDGASGAWVERARLQPEDTQAGGGFGSAIAVSDDRILVGAPGADQGRGAIHPVGARRRGVACGR